MHSGSTTLIHPRSSTFLTQLYAIVVKDSISTLEKEHKRGYSLKYFTGKLTAKHLWKLYAN